MIRRKQPIQSLQSLKIASRLVMMIFGGEGDSKLFGEIDSSVEEVFKLNSIPLVYLPNQGSEGHFFKMSPEFSLALKQDQDRYHLWKEAFRVVKDLFKHNNIRYLFIKTPSFFPYTSGNLDVLVQEEDFLKAGDLLKGEGFIELKNIREPYKYLYKKFNIGEEIVPIHLHSRVFWGATFLESKSLWQNAQKELSDDVVFSLGNEDCILTTLAHSFYENSGIKLLDLCIIKYALGKADINWSYMDSMTRRFNWNEGYSSALLIYDRLHEQLFSSSMIPAEILEKARDVTAQHRPFNRPLNNALKSNLSMPFPLPLMLCKPLLYKKIFSSKEFGNLACRFTMLVKVVMEEGFINLLKLNVQRSTLIAFSGIDGSGKSSYSKALEKTLDGCGLESNYIWARVGSLSGFQLIKRIIPRRSFQMDAIKGCDETAKFNQTQSYLERGWRGSLWRLVNIIDFCVFYNAKVRWSLLRRKVVICDRFVPDIFADLYSFSKTQNKTWLRILSQCLPKPAVNYLLVVPSHVALNRSKDKECLSYLNRQQELYKYAELSLNLSAIDTQLPFDENCNALINSAITQYYNSKCVYFGWDQ